MNKKLDQTSALVNSIGYVIFLILGTIMLSTLIKAGAGVQLTLGIIYFIVHLFFWPIQMSYHILQSRMKEAKMLQRIDRSSLLYLIAAIFTPILLKYGNRPTALVIVIIIWLIAGVGTVAILTIKTLSRKVAPIFGFVAGLIGIFGLMIYITQLPSTQIIQFVSGTLIFIGAGAVYAIKKPDLKPGTFGFHELFHTLLTIAAIVLHFLVVASLV